MERDMQRWLSALTLAGLAGCSLSNEIYMEGRTLYFNGEITAEKVTEAIELANVQPNGVVAMMIDSDSGEYRPAMELGRWVYTNQVHLIVNGTCASACANYVLTAAPSTLVMKGSDVLWFGGAMQDEWDVDGFDQKELEQWQQSLSLWRQHEDAFFALVDVNPKITMFGHMNKREKLHKAGCDIDDAAWMYHIDDMQKLGLNNIVYADPDALITARKDAPGCVINLEDSDF
ncbi:hypothetical protein M0357_005516 [Vibrio harveyi]|nr:hypothetical protein [Vibrio harveyi]EKO3823667.1 hypothetical protein [Vibrio harveyi]EKO3848368.1 hypothetical protein [Vibrio harveyi]EKO3850332.1 hypothetical protein [Vibrio harveyi]EKY4194232.1 hypothetical protein [Vibrio harveyi]